MTPISPSIRVLGIGSPSETDNLGFLVAHALQGGFDAGQVEITALDRPGPRLIEHMRGADTVILIDAVKSGAPVGTLHRLQGRDLNRVLLHRTSTHGFGLEEALQLAERLQELPPNLLLIGVEVGTAPPAPAHLAALVEAVRGEVAAALARGAA